MLSVDKKGGHADEINIKVLTIYTNGAYTCGQRILTANKTRWFFRQTLLETRPIYANRYRSGQPRIVVIVIDAWIDAWSIWIEYQ